MAVDKLVDSAQLDSDLTSVADAIRAKSGGSSQLSFPAGFVSEIQAIPSGGGGGLDLSVLSNMTIGDLKNGLGTEDININAPNLTAIYVQIIASAINIKVTGVQSFTTFSAGLTASQSGKDKLVKLDLDGANINVTTSSLRYRPHLVELNAKIKVAGANNFLTRCDALEEIRFQENATTVAFSIIGAPLLSNDSLVSIANGLSDSTTATLTATAAQKTAMNGIMGTVSGGVFTIASGGSVSLQSFITSTKGWTLA